MDSRPDKTFNGKTGHGGIKAQVVRPRNSLAEMDPAGFSLGCIHIDNL
jgi:hypothetical protein